MLVPDDRVPILSRVVSLYGCYLLSILGFWYKPPFRGSSDPHFAHIRFWLALIPALLLNGIMVALVWRGHFGPSPTTVEDDVANAVKICGLLSFLAGPATVYYFGFRPKGGTEAVGG